MNLKDRIKCKLGFHKDIKEISRRTILWYGYNAFSHYEVEYKCESGCKIERKEDKNGNIKIGIFGL